MYENKRILKITHSHIYDDVVGSSEKLLPTFIIWTYDANKNYLYFLRICKVNLLKYLRNSKKY